MEISLNNMGVEDLQSKQSEPGLALNPGEAFIQIDSISIDLPNGNGKNEKTPKCEHFSIRKYVSDMRHRDKKVFWPFKSDVKCSSTELVPEYLLPPLDVPKFRWWQCHNCLQGVYEKENGKLAPVNNFNGDCNTDNPLCAHVALTGSETREPVPEFKHILKLDNSAEKGEADADLLAQATATESHDLYCSNQKEERDDGSNGAIKVTENGLEDNAYRGLPRPIANAAELKESHGQEQELDDAGLQSVSANNEVTSVENAPKDLLLQRDASHDDDQEMMGMNSSRASPVAVDGVDCGPDTLTVWQNGHPPDELGYPSSDNAEICPGNRLRDKISALRHRKVQKVRLLTDLLGQKGDSNRNSIGAEESPLLVISDASEEFSAKKVFQGRKTKRKFHPGDECKVDSSNQEANDIEIVVRDAEENHKASVGTVEDGAHAMTSQGGIMKNGWTPHGEDESSGLVAKKRKKKKNGVETLQHEAVVLSEMENDAYSLMGPRGTPTCNLSKHIDVESLRADAEKRKKNKLIQESFQDRPDESRGQAAVDFSHTSCSHNALMSREMCCSSSPVLHTYRNSCMCKKKSKMPQVDDEHIARIPHSSSSVLGEDFVSGIKFGLVQSSPTTARLLPDGEGTIKKGTSLSSYSSKTEARHASSLDYFPACTISCQHVGPEGQAQKKVVASTHTASNVPSRSRLDGFVKKGASYNHKGKEASNGTPYPNEKQHYASRFDDMGHFLMPQKEISSATSKGEITGSLVQSAVTKNHSNKTSNKTSARGTCSDDIPMDIVELMAKIQYENSLHDTVKDQSQLETRKSPSYQNLRLDREYENGDLNLLQNEGSTGLQIVPKYVKKLHNAKPKAVDINYYPQVSTNYQMMTQVQKNQNQNQNPFEGHGASFSRYHEKPNRSKRNEGTIANNYKKGSGGFGDIAACDTCHVAGTSKEPFHLWSSSTTPITHAPSSRNVIPSFMLQSSDSKSPGLKVKNKYEQSSKGFLAEISNGKNSNALRPNGLKVQSPLGSSDFYSNEKIPALHLLSLMDAHSGQNVNGNSRLAKQSSWIPHGCSSNELNFGAYSASETLRHSSSDYHSINSLASGKYSQRSSTFPVLGSSSWFEFNENNRNGVMGQVPLKVRGKGKQKCSDLVGSMGGSSQKDVIPGCIPIPVHNQQMNEFTGVPNAVDIPPKCRIADKPEKEHLRSSTGSVWPLRYSLEMGICTINRNPAEFSVPEAGNAYTIGGTELRFRKKVGALDRSTTFIRDLNKPKRGRKKKTATATNQQAQNHHHQIL